MASIPNGWTEEGSMLTRSIECKDFKHAVELINQIADVAEDMQHHPEITLKDYKQLSISTTSHESQSLTDKDYELAQRISNIIN